MPNEENLKHLVVTNSATPHEYTSPSQAPRPKFPERVREDHARHLLDQLTAVRRTVEQKTESRPVGVPAPDGIYLEIDGQVGFDLKIQSLDLPSKGIELLSVKTTPSENGNEKITATIFVPQDKISTFIQKVEQYRDEETAGGTPKNKPLVEGIENLRLAVVQSLWTDLADVFPTADESIWWEVWLRATPDAIPRFKNFAQSRDILVGQRVLMFPDRHVLLANTTARKIAASIDTLGFIAELRRAKETTADFLEMNIVDQRNWVDAVSGLLDAPSVTAPRICILDTGIHKPHLLIDRFIQNDSLHACNPQWGTNDHDGHGTEMAGLALFGNLEDALQSQQRIQIPADLESVKVLPPDGENHPDLYGSITEEAISRATVPAPEKERIVCMAITSTDARDQGQPSSWSAALDKICSGEIVAGKKHLFIVSAGNTEGDYLQYPSTNLTEGVHDPGQSWNALTVGAYTERDRITEPSFAGWSALAPVGDIAPATTTSLTFKRGKWPIKPEVVFEGGNSAINSTRDQVDYPSSLSLLTTSRSTNNQMFTWFADTSAASAQAANFAAKIVAAYPNFWPETTRALMVHSASWTPRMKQAYPNRTKTERESLLRTCGYGVPDLAKALWSARNSLTLVAQDELKPFEKNSMKEMNFHQIPWPTEALETLGEARVRMKVTLSYFIEPNPARRGWEHKFSYQSHGLRFDVKTPTESTDDFITRINRERWDEEQGRPTGAASDIDEWYFGKQARSKGSLHSDWWEGTAASLAARSEIAVFPVMGWWRLKHSEGHTSKKARYSLIVTIETDEVNADIYTPVKTVIDAQTLIETW